ncbi:hypothetical protein IRI77_31705 [Paludibaculum fermentans]|uniref:Uncharacterized protein n=2 Tax=Paludibaculum fermentans TaxID=1473598 RepID=A0A7S7NZM8_PALFE|nr:hypothetical protein IRI77_31705 [Paludibaculum fermentans]
MGLRDTFKTPPTGLCESCAWVRRIENDRGSVFLLCRRALTDSGYPKYPRLPVLRCPGHEPAPSPAAPTEK